MFSELPKPPLCFWQSHVKDKALRTSDADKVSRPNVNAPFFNASNKMNYLRVPLHQCN